MLQSPRLREPEIARNTAVERWRGTPSSSMRPVDIKASDTSGSNQSARQLLESYPRRDGSTGPQGTRANSVSYE